MKKHFLKNKKQERILEKAYPPLTIERENIDVYKLNDGQKAAIQEAREQIKRGDFLTDNQANREIDKWL
ncbi:hypothetical protein QWY31_01070 [Cytophagales bacterium LB-30]|uniref:CopG family transcriptional regulator n=1 Tax=Shiella aurantiaca TaxID=3058365 RepID=A0ABT8F0V0_9BACT|nr:hypothetical protein [Shiella aurantiaca]MDN4164067.1 hypothetical protein [Shiella aurantiaca]